MVSSTTKQHGIIPSDSVSDLIVTLVILNFSYFFCRVYEETQPS